MIFGLRLGVERETPWEGKFFWGKAGAFWDISPPRGESPLSGEAFEVDGEKCLI